MIEVDAAKALEELRSGNGDEIPSGWLTTRQWADEWGLSESRTGVIIRDGVRSGKIQKKLFRINVGERLLPVPHYAVRVGKSVE